jgi:hypothetical protein
VVASPSARRSGGGGLEHDKVAESSFWAHEGGGVVVCMHRVRGEVIVRGSGLAAGWKRAEALRLPFCVLTDDVV